MEAKEVLRRMPWVQKPFIEFYVANFIFTRSSKMKICLKKNELYPTCLYLYQVLHIGMLSLHCEVDKESWQIKMYFPTLQGPVNHAIENVFNTCRISDDHPSFFSWTLNQKVDLYHSSDVKQLLSSHLLQRTKQFSLCVSSWNEFCKVIADTCSAILLFW